MREELLTILTSATPISELRGAIPLALAFGFSPLKAYVLAVLGNAAIVAPVLLFLKHGSVFAATHSEWCRRVLDWVFERTRRKHGATFERMGFVALLLFVAVPLPMTGAWTGSVIAFLVNMPFWKAFTAILIGVLLAGAAVLALSLGVVHLW